jgi:hypothetical protein
MAVPEQYRSRACDATARPIEGMIHEPNSFGTGCLLAAATALNWGVVDRIKHLQQRASLFS